MTRKQLNLWFAALTLTLLSLVAALHFVLSPAPPKQSVPAPKPRAIQTMPEPSRGSAQVFLVTAYTYTGNPTATGTMPQRGTMAADPTILPYGTRLFVPGYGYGIVTDCGGLIKGNRLDLFMESHEEAIAWGCRTVEVRIEKE